MLMWTFIVVLLSELFIKHMLNTCLGKPPLCVIIMGTDLDQYILKQSSVLTEK